jgi:hypothetical protein
MGMAISDKGLHRLRAPSLYNLRADPFERGDTSMLYDGWKAHPMFAFVPAQALVAEWLESCKEFPPRQKPSSFNLDEVIRKMSEYGKS